MTELPNGWTWMRLRELAVLKGGITKGNKRSRTSPTRLVPYLRVANVQRGFLDLEKVKEIEADETEINTLQLRPGDVLFNEGGDRDKLGRGWIWNGELPICIHQNHVFRARIRDGLLLPKLLSWYGNSLGQSYFLEHGKQTTNLASINLTLLGDLPVPVPPLDQQAPLVAEIETQTSRIDAGVAALKRVQANLKRYRASVLKAACEGHLVPTEADLARRESRDYEPASVLLQRILKERRHHWEASELAKLKAKGKPPTDDQWRAKYREPNPPDMAALPELPAGWCWTNIGQLADVGTGATPKRGHAAYYEGGTIPWVTSSVVNQHSVASATEFVTELALRETNLTVYPPGTLLLAMYGEGKTRGRVSELAIAAATNQALAALEFRGAALECKPFARLRLEAHYLDLRLAASGGVQPNINLEIVRAIAVPLPPSVERGRIEEEVGRRLSLVDGLGECARRNLVRAGNVRNAILNAAFAGKLTPVATPPRSNPTLKASERVALRSTPNTNAELTDA